jgi:YesN/AraC family two-component response regulator
VQEAEDGDDLISHISESEPDVVLMDLRMPARMASKQPRSSANNIPP